MLPQRSTGLAVATAGLLLLAACLAAQGPPTSGPSEIPFTGRAGPGLEHLDGVILRILERDAIPGATLAITKDGRLVLARGYGWADLEDERPARPEMLFGLASVSKSLTAVTILKLVEQGRLRLDERVFHILKHIRPLPGERVDPRIHRITVRMLLDHSGGWNRAVSGDPTAFGRRVARRLRVRPPITPEMLIRYMLGQPLDFDPGTQQHYSNYGYLLLGQIIEHVTDRPYAEAVREIVLEPIGMRRARLPNREKHYAPDEARRYLAGTDKLLAPEIPPLIHASGGWTASAIDMVHFLTTLDGSRGKPFLSEKMYATMLAPPRPPLQPRSNGSWFGLGWDVVLKTEDGLSYSKNGAIAGVKAFMQHLPNGVNWVVLFNGSPDHEDAEDHGHYIVPWKPIQAAIEKTTGWPTDIDLFPHYPL